MALSQLAPSEQPPVEPGKPARNRNVAVCMALVLGGFGAHKFYLGQRRQGFLYLAFFWTLVPGILATFEGLHYLRMSDQEFRDVYG